MTTSVKVHVNGKYQAKVTRQIEGQQDEVSTVLAQEEKSYTAPHGKRTVFIIEESDAEEKAPADEKADEDEDGA